MSKETEDQINKTVNEVVNKHKSKLTIFLWIFGGGWGFLCTVAAFSYNKLMVVENFIVQTEYINSHFPKHVDKDDSVDAVFFKDIDTLKTGQNSIISAIANKKFNK